MAETPTDPTWLDYAKLIQAGASGYSNAAAQSRAAELEAQVSREGLRQTGERGYNDAIAQREKDRQDSASSAYKRLLQYDHINAGGTQTPMVSPYSRPIEAPGANAKRLSSDEGIVNELHQRASFGDPYFPGSPGLSDSNLNRLRVPGSDNPGDVYNSMTLRGPGAGETAANIAGTVAPIVGAATKGHWYDWLKHLFKPGKKQETTPALGGVNTIGAGGNDPVGTTPTFSPWPWEGQCDPGEVWMGPSGGCVKG